MIWVSCFYVTFSLICYVGILSIFLELIWYTNTRSQRLYATKKVKWKFSHISYISEILSTAVKKFSRDYYFVLIFNSLSEDILISKILFEYNSALKRSFIHYKCSFYSELVNSRLGKWVKNTNGVRTLRQKYEVNPRNIFKI